MEDKPIRARRPNLLQKTVKWSRRHRSGVATAIAVAFIVTVASAGLFWHGKNREATQRQRAEKNLRVGLDAVDQIYLEYFLIERSEERAATPQTVEFLRKLLLFYEQFAEANPQDTSVRRSIVTAYSWLAADEFRLGARDQAEAGWQRAAQIAQQLVSHYANNREFRVCLADVHYQRGKAYWECAEHHKAIEACNEAIRVCPEHARAYGQRGWAYLLTGNWEQAVADFNQQIRLAPDFTWAYFARAVAYLSRDPDQAISDCTKAIELHPTLGSAYKTRADAYRMKGEFDKAMADHNKAIELYRRTAHEVHRHGNLYYISRGYTYLAKGDWEKAAADFDEAICIDPERLSPHRGVAIARARLGQIEAARTHVAKMEQICFSGPTRNNEPRGSNELAWFLVTCPAPALWDAGRAVQLAGEAVTLSPKNGAVWNTLGVARYRGGQWKEAISALEKSRELRGDNSCDFLFLAMAYWQLGDKKEGRKWYDKAVEWIAKSMPHNEELRRFRAEAAELLGIDNQQPE